jgi:hypothetical protein
MRNGMTESINDCVSKAIFCGLLSSDPGAYIDADTGVIDGRFNLGDVSKAVCEAIRDHLKNRLEFDEEGVLQMLEGKKGPLEKL